MARPNRSRVTRTTYDAVRDRNRLPASVPPWHATTPPQRPQDAALRIPGRSR